MKCLQNSLQADIQKELNNRRKNHLRSLIAQDRLSYLVLLSYEHNLARELNYESVIGTFASARARSVNIRSSS